MSDTETRPRLNIDAIKRAAAQHYQITVEELEGRRKTLTIAQARQVAMFLARLKLHWSYPELGLEFERDHTTIIDACRRIAKQFLSDEKIRADVQAIASALGLGEVMVQMNMFPEPTIRRKVRAV